MAREMKPAVVSGADGNQHLLASLLQKEAVRGTDQEKFTFRLEEYRMLRTEIESYSKQKRQLEISVITAVVLIYGWIIVSKPDTLLERLALLAPTVITLWGTYRFIFYNRVIGKEVQYIKERIENVIMGSEGGWEAFWEKSRTERILHRTEYIFWLTALIITLTIPFLIPTFRGP